MGLAAQVLLGVGGAVPDENEIMWCVAGNGWLYEIPDPERAGRTVVTISM